MALIDDISIRKERRENITDQQVISRVKAKLWQRIQERRNDRVYIHQLEAYVRAGDLEDAFEFLLGPRKDQ